MNTIFMDALRSELLTRCLLWHWFSSKGGMNLCDMREVGTIEARCHSRKASNLTSLLSDAALDGLSPSGGVVDWVPITQYINIAW